jgi:autotransporter-associated beta strand protein
MRSIAVALLAAAMLLPQPGVQAKIVGPYTVDPVTLHLWHLNESAVPAIDSVSNPPGTNCINLANTATLGNSSYPGFGTALSTGTNDSATATRSQFLSPFTSTGTFAFADATTKAFTFEALVWIGFDPSKNLGTTANGGNNRNAPCQIMAIEGGSGQRIFQFRLSQVGTSPGGTGNPAVKNVPYLTFENITAGQPTVFADVPTNGPDAIVSNQWYHVAVSYNGVPNTANNIKFYWTLLDPSRTIANQIPITSAQTTSSGPTVASSTSCAYEIGNQARNNNGNFLGLIDEVRISNVERSAAQMMFIANAISIVTQPASQLVAAGDTVSLSVVATGVTPSYQWQFHGTNLNPVLYPTSTNATLVLANITAAQAGSYQVIVSNSFNSMTSTVAVIQVGGVVPEMFNSGLDANRAPLPGAVIDPHYTVITDPSQPSAPAYADSAPPSNWLPNTSSSQWIAPTPNGNAAGIQFTYQTTFLMDTLDPAHAQITGGWAIDNAGLDILLNGVSQGLTANGFGSLTPFIITNGFIPGINTLDFVTTNFPGGGNNPTGLRVEMRGVGSPLPPTAPYITTFPVNVVTQAQQSTMFAVAAVGSAPLTYQWYNGASRLIGQTNRTLALNALLATDSGTYTVFVTNNVGWTNASAILTVFTSPQLVWLGDDPVNPSFWDSVTFNWLETRSSARTTFAAFDDVLFDSRGVSTPTVDLQESLSPNTVTANATTDYTLTGPGSIIGNVFVVKLNTGTLIMDTANTYSGLTRIEAGTLQVGNADTSGTLGGSAVSNNAALVFNRADSFTVLNPISGPGSVAMAGFGTLVLGGNNTYTGPTFVNSGTLNVNGARALGTTASGTFVASGAQLFLDPGVNIGAEPLTISGTGTGLGALHKGGGNAAGTTFGGPITLAADAGIGVDPNATLNLTNSAGITGTNANLALECDGTSTATVSGAISLGTGGISEFGTGTWTLLGTNNNWTGGTTINSGTLAIGDGGTNGSLGSGPINDNGTLTFNSAGNITITDAISGGGALNQNGPGRLTLTAANSYGGNTTIRGSGVLRITDGGALGSGTCTIGGAQTDTCRLEVLGGLTVNNPIAIFPRVFYQTPPPDPVVAPDILNVSGTNTFNPPSSIIIASGGNLLTLQSDSGKLIMNAGVTASGVGRHFVMRGAALGEIFGNIDFTGANSQFVWKLDSGTWTVWGNMTPGAATTISNGVLVLNGTLDNILTNAGGMLSGTGVLSGPVYIKSGATLAPGPSIGTMTMNSNLTLLSGSTTAMEINKGAGTWDQLVGMSNVVYGGTLIVTNLSGTLAAGDTFKLFTAAAYSGAFASFSLPSLSAGLSWNTSALPVDGTLRVQTGTVTQPTVSSVVLSGSNLILRGGNGLPGSGYSVVSSTNVAAALSTWSFAGSGIFDGSGNYSFTNPVSPATHKLFLRVRVP